MLPFAAFDSLSIVRRVCRDDTGVSLPEIQCISYLGCLLFVYSGGAAASWGYDFAATPNSSPFSVDLLQTVEMLAASGYLLPTGHAGYLPTEVGERTEEHLRGSFVLRDRIRCLDAALDASEALPLPAIRAAIALEPQVAKAAILDMPAPLLDQVGLLSLRGDFEALESQLGSDADLVVPAVVWLSFMLRSGSGLDPSDGGVVS